jgi:signal transduction histidine kinase
VLISLLAGRYVRFVDRVVRFLKHQPRVWLYLEAIGLIFVIVFVDYVTGYEVTIYPFYAVPILLMVWFGDLRVAIAISVTSTLLWWVVDKAVGHVYSNEWLRVWEAVVRSIFFGLVLFAGWSVKRQRQEVRTRIELLERSQNLEDEIINISEREQQRIGRDLHDGVSQYLAAIGLTATMLKKELEKTSTIQPSRLGEIADHLRDAATRVRQLARGLSPVDQDRGGLESALEELAASTSKLTGIACSFVGSGPDLELSNTAAIHLFRIAQEAVSNVVKHAHARMIVIALDTANGSSSLRVSDDGVGFSPSVNEKRGMGLNTMRYRARMIGGELEIQPNVPSGTTVICSFVQDSEPRSSSHE